MPVSDPVVALIVPIDGVEVLHVPPLLLLVSVVDEPTQTVSVPPIADGVGYTETTNVEKQPELIVYEIVAVPAEGPPTKPGANTTATEELLLLQVPPSVVVDKVVVPPTQIEAEPVIGAGDG